MRRGPDVAALLFQLAQELVGSVQTVASLHLMHLKVLCASDAR